MTKARTLADNFAADINGITAGTGITGGGTSGTVTVTNSMATEIDAKGDLVVGTGADTFSRLAVASTAGYLLSVDSGETTGLIWVEPASLTFADYTPSYTNITIGNGTVVARYAELGKYVFVYFNFTLGSTSSISSNPRITIPVEAKSTNFVGPAYGLDAGTVEVIGQTVLNSATEMNFYVPLNGSYGSTQMNATFPWTWTTNDQVKLLLTYEAL
jgi:hypothetical protein